MKTNQWTIKWDFMYSQPRHLGMPNWELICFMNYLRGFYED